jgi:hypothetical protein
MKVVGQFNNVSEKLKKELIKPLKRGQSINFRLLNGELDLGTGRMVFGSSVGIPTFDRIWDPYHKEIKGEGDEVTYEGDYVDIGVPQVIKDNRVERCKKFFVNASVVGIPGNGTFSFTGGNISDMEFYEIFCLSNKNGLNKHRATDKDPIYEMIDPSLEAEKDNIVTDELELAIMTARNLSADDINIFCRAMGWDQTQPAEVKKSRVKKFAREFPKEFNEKQSDKSLLRKSDIKNALDLGVILYDPKGHKIVDGSSGNNRTIAVLERVEGENHIDSFERWIDAAKNGQDVWKQISKQVKTRLTSKNVENTEAVTN